MSYQITNRAIQSRTHGARRQQLLNAAATLILDRGAVSLTLEAVSEAAHVSKGGLLYHFDSKAALLEALVDELSAQLENEIDQQLAAETDSGVSRARAYLRAVARMGELPRSQQVCKALTFICAAQPEFVRRVQERISHLSQVRTAEAMSLEELHLRLVADGLWLADIFGCHHITPQRRAALLELLDPGHSVWS